MLLATAGELLIAGARGPQVVAMLVLIAAEGAVELGASPYGINSVSLRQTALLAGLGTLLSFLWIARSPVRRLQMLPPSATA